ncbi:MAG: hypothetical protein HDR73_08720 [Clavibacter sp.]|nr:hypothetical protein [Clavibacter sp.]
MIIITRLCNAILRGKFAFERYLQPRKYFGWILQTTPLFCSYGQIGYVVNFPFSTISEYSLEYDWEMNKLHIVHGDTRTLIER